MAIERKDRVKDTTTTTGTGTVTLTGTAPSGYRSVSAAHTDGATVRYAISMGAEWEVGEGVYTASGTTLSRASVFASSNAGALVNFSAGTKDVITTLTASEVDELVKGPASATANSLARFDGTTGKLLKDGAVIGTDVQAYSSILAGVSSGTTDLGGFRNRLINPRGAVYQRTVAATADDTYFADRWYALTQTGTITPSVLTDPEDGYPSGIRLTQSQASAQRFGFAQIIEGKNCKDMRGSSGVLVPRIRASASQAIRYAILGWTGTEDTVTSDVVNDWTSGTYTAGNFFLASNVSVIAVGSQTPSANTWTSLTALTAALGSTLNNIVVMVWTEGTAAQNFTLDFDYVQMEKGAIALPFEIRAYEHERSLCLPYTTELSSGSAFTLVPGYGYRVSTTIADTEIRLLPVMRSPPTLNTGGATFSSAGVTGNVWSVYNNVSAGYVTAVGAVTLTIANASKYGAQLRTTAGTSLSGSSGDGCTFYIGTTAKILLESEL